MVHYSEKKKTWNMGDKMSDKYEFPDDIMKSHCFEKLNKIGLINHTKLRDIKMKREFIMLRNRMDSLDAAFLMNIPDHSVCL